MSAISEKIVQALGFPPAGNKVHFFSGAKLQGREAPAGFGVRCTAGGNKSFIWFHRVDGRKHLETIGPWNPKGGGLSVYEAIGECINRKKAIAKGIDKKGRDVDPRPERTRRLQDGDQPKDKTVAGVLDQFVARYVEKDAKLRSAGMVKQQLDRLVKPRIGKIGIYDLKRSQVSRMLDEIADDHGPRMADLALAYTRKAFNWYEINGHDDDFKSPIVRGMARLKPSERERDRILSDDEIRALWKATEATGPFGTMMRFITLTACRRSEAASMVRSEVADGVWTIPASRSKTKIETILPLSMTAQDVLASIPKIKGVDFVFTTGDRPISGFSKFKAKIDKDCSFADWTIHDLRRTARSLMSRAGVPTDHAERCLGHVISGVRGVYDRHQYLNEKRDAFEKLASIINNILNPSKPSNVRTLRRV